MHSRINRLSPYSERMSAPPSAIRLLIGDDDEAVSAAAATAVAEARATWPTATVMDAGPASEWPFQHPLCTLPPGPVIVVAPAAHEATDVTQPSHCRLVTTQASYLFTAWEALLLAHGQACLVASARRAVLTRQADEVIRQRGVFARVVVETVAGEGAAPEPTTPLSPAARAFRAASAADRLAAMVAVLDAGRTAPALVATASVCQEVNDLDGAARDLDEALSLAPDWAAAWFERGKVWLRRDDMAAATEAFRAATDRLPRFGGAWGNLGATLGELDRTAEALDAFTHLLALDPDSPQAINNVGVVTRELGRLGESEAAFRRVTELEPARAFGYYNLGHTLFLQGRYHAAATAYGQGQARDPERNPVQASRLALCRLATGDAAGALSELRGAAAALPRDYRRQVLGDTSAILWALVTQKPDLTGWQPVHEWLQAELARSA